MISYWDQDYIRTKRIKLGHAEMEAPFRSLADWIAQRFQVPVPLNIEHEYVELVKSPRLQVILEHEKDVHEFKDSAGNFDVAKQRAVANRFCEFLAAAGDYQTDTDEMFVIFTAFEPVARWEANSAIKDDQIEAIRREIGSQLIWTIKPMLEAATFFFHTDKQMSETEGQLIRDRCIDVYMATLRSFDEFGYFKDKPILTRFDSKENFERSYGGSWFKYFR